MDLVALYLGMVVLGYIVGMLLKKKDKRFAWTGKITFVCIMLLVFTMGARIGANEQVVASLGTIGVAAFVLTALAFIGSIAATFAARKVLGIDREGGRKDD